MTVHSGPTIMHDPPAQQSETVYLEHAEDVLNRWLVLQAAGDVALVVVTRTMGGGVRAPGALMAVSASGDKAGYISGGCIDADVVLHAREGLRTGIPLVQRYGAGSPFIDLRLPCGGMIEVAILPRVDRQIIQRCHAQLVRREPATLDLTPALTPGNPQPFHTEIRFRYEPKMRLRIAGRGADCLALGRLATASGIHTSLQLREGADVAEALRLGFTSITPLQTPSALSPLQDDPWTAFLLAFHDTDWEAPLLAQALAGPAFYIGAVGSRKTHAARCNQLHTNGSPQSQIDRIHGPVGLIASMRDASMLAVSVLAEIVQAFDDHIRQGFTRTALILLAAGQSSRFEGGDKLLAMLGDRPLLAHSAAVLAAEQVGARIAVVGPNQFGRAEILRLAGWTIVVNDAAATGLASSIAAGVRSAAETATIDAAMVLLADMPYVHNEHLQRLREALTPDRSGVMSRHGSTILPPAIFSRSTFDQLTTLQGDTGARTLFEALDNTATISAPKGSGIDIDTRQDLERLGARRQATPTA